MIRRLLTMASGWVAPNKERKIIDMYLRSIIEKSWDDGLMKSVTDFEVRTPATLECYGPAVKGREWIRAWKAFDQEYLYELQDVMLSTSTGACWLQDGRIIGESFGSLNRLLSNKSFRDEYVTSQERLDAEVIALPFVGGFFHFMFELLPAALAAQAWRPEFSLLLPTQCAPYVKAYATLIAGDRVIYASGPLRVRKLIVAGKTPYSGFVQQAEISRIQTFFAAKFPVRRAEELLYISRRHDKRRSLENEGQLEEELRSLGFKICILQEMHVIEQIKLFQSAAVVLGPHGAGLSNLIWCNQGISVIEIFPFRPRNDCYSRLAYNLRLNYSSFICSESGKSAGIIPIDEVLRAVNRITKGQ